ncbi:TPA: ATP-binding protein [Clostridioides difficile]|nr:ATP-binding protein [Clostridioides difficile]HBF6311741.1 ATP-binding protein [Clostridioides difficile]HBF8970529.1 ATP-binding protein [Clostridioides difficile]HBF9837159.1 ATP-binding protein [Clostridioides difficile]HBG4110109.1 ATP-binding protein [Clostridioides difficile]
MRKNIFKKDNLNPFFLNDIQPQGGISFKDRVIVKGDGYETCIYVYFYPGQVNEFWLNSLTSLSSLDNAIITIDVGTEDKQKALESINKSLIEQESRYYEDKDKISQIKAKNTYGALHTLADNVTNQGEAIKLIQVRFYISDKEKDSLENKVKDIMQELEGIGFRGTVCLNELEYDWQSLYYGPIEQKKFKNKRKGKAVPASSLAGGYPFHFTSLNDPTGILLGQTFTGGNVIFDLFTKTDIRKFYNAVLFGTMGVGKSTTLKKLLLNNAIIGNIVRLLDITGEFKPVITLLGGRIISLDGTGEIINPLQILSTMIDEETFEVLNKESFMMHMSKMSMMYNYIAINPEVEEVREFDKLLSKFYNHFGIEIEKATEYESKEYPIMSDLLKFAKEEMYVDVKKEEIRKNLTVDKQRRLENIILNLESIVRDYGALFDGHSTITDITNEQIISFQLRNLSQYDKRIFRTQIFNILTLLWNNALKIGTKEKKSFDNGLKTLEDIMHYLIIIDEAHTIINSENIMAVDYLITCEREFRKYFGGLLYATQSIRDMVPETIDSTSEVFGKIKTLFELTQYKFIMQQDSNAMASLRKIFEGQLSESEIKSIPNLGMGQCILSINGMSNIKFKVLATEEEKKLFAGGA